MRLVVQVKGRPAPQGSKRGGAVPGVMLEQSAYLPSWRAAVRIAAYVAYAEARIDPSTLPVFPAGTPVTIEVCTFRMIRGAQCGAIGSDLPIGTPDVDKLLRSTLDALGGAPRSARMFADDSQVVAIRSLQKVWGNPEVAGLEPGATIIICDGRD